MKLYDLYIINNGWERDTELLVEFMECGIVYHEKGPAEILADKYRDCEVQCFIENRVAI